VAEGGTRHLNHIRDLAPLLVEKHLDAPENDSVASPSEALLAALANLELVVEVDVGLSSLWERSSSEIEPAGFGTIRVTVHVDTDASPEAIRALIAHAVLWPPSPTLCMIR